MGRAYQVALRVILIVLASALAGGGPQASGQLEQTRTGEDQFSCQTWTAGAVLRRGCSRVAVRTVP